MAALRAGVFVEGRFEDLSADLRAFNVVTIGRAKSRSHLRRKKQEALGAGKPCGGSEELIRSRAADA